MAKKRVHITTAVNAANVSKSGSTYTIRDVVGTVDDIVMNRRLYPAKELASGAVSLNGKPAPAGHPKNAAGKHISAANGEALVTAWIGAYCANARHEGGRTVTDIIVNGDMAAATPKGKELVARLDAAIAGTNAGPIHVSTGLDLIPVEAKGEGLGKSPTTRSPPTSNTSIWSSCGMSRAPARLRRGWACSLAARRRGGDQGGGHLAATVAANVTAG